MNRFGRVWKSKWNVGYLFLSLVIILGILSTPVFAADIEISVPEDGIEIGKTVTLPVIMHDAIDVSTFTIEVENTNPHVTITINPSRPLEEGSYEVATNPEKASQKILWYGMSDISGDEIELFSIDVTADKGAMAEIPITLNTIEVARITKTGGVDDLTSSYPTTTAKLTLIDGETESAVVDTSGTSQKDADKISNVPLMDDVTSSVLETADSPVISTVPSVSETSAGMPVQAADISVPQKTPAAETPLGIFPVVLGITAVVGIIIRNKERIL